MKLSKYFIRVGKYIIELIVLFVILFGVMSLLNGKVSFSEYFSAFLSQRGLILCVVIVIFALSYPFFGFTKKRLTFDANKYAEDVDRVMTMCGFVKVSQDETNMIYKAKSVSKKIFLLYEDEIVITTEDGLSVIEGPRKEAVKASMRFETFITLNQ